MADGPSDLALLTRARDGDEPAFVLLYERHRDPVFRFAWRMLGSVEAAEDIAHDCFLALMRWPLRFDPARGSLRAYLFGAARNLSLKQLRDSHPEGAKEEPAVEGPPLQGLLDREVACQVRAAVASLPPLQREVLILVEYEEWSLAEVAEVVEAEVGTVKARLHRARESLRERLAGLRPTTARAPMGDRR